MKLILLLEITIILHNSYGDKFYQIFYAMSIKYLQGLQKGEVCSFRVGKR